MLTLSSSSALSRDLHGLGDLRPLLRHHPAAAGRLRHLLHRPDSASRAAWSADAGGARRSGASTASTSRSGCSTSSGCSGRPGQFRHVDGMGPPGHRGHRRPALAHHGRLGGRDLPHLGARAADRHLLRRPAVLGRPTTSPPSSASSGSPSRISCSRWSSCTSASRCST